MRDAAQIIDLSLYRAEHSVTLTGKRFAQAYHTASVQRAHFDGCSNDGLMPLMQDNRRPTDYDGWYHACNTGVLVFETNSSTWLQV
jgi:hypothetical protein